MIYKIRAILDTESDVFRDIEIDGENNLIDLHSAIKSAFGMSGEEMSAFYQSNDQWYQGSEIPLENMSDDGQDETMDKVSVAAAFPQESAKMIFVYDFFAMWTFFVELIKIEPKKENENYPKTVLKYGETPEENTLKEMKIEIDDLDLDEEEELF